MQGGRLPGKLARPLTPTMRIGGNVNEQTKQMSTGQPTPIIVDDSDDDPDFRRGPIPEEKGPQRRSRKSGKRKEPELVKQTSQSRQKRRRTSKAHTQEPIRNPLIELLGVDGDSYFQQCDKDKEEEEEDAEEAEEEDMDANMVDNPMVRPRSSSTALNRKAVTQIEDESMSDATTEADDEEIPDGPSIWDMRDKILAMMSRNATQQESSKAALRRQKREKDPEATESDSDDSVGPLLALQSPERPIHTIVSHTIELFEPKPRFNSLNPPPNIGPHILHGTDSIQIPSSINRWLRPYQRKGIEFLWERYYKGVGGILGDDMGLGKTVQIISFLSAIMKKNGDTRDMDRRKRHTANLQDRGYRLAESSIDIHPLLMPKANVTWPTCLLVAPAVLLSNWRSELETWGYFEFETYDAKSAKGNLLRDFRLGRLDIVLVSMDTMSRNSELFCDLDWSVVIVDEAHKMKNPSSQIQQAMSTVNCARRFALTGTAVQNNYEELWTLLNWTNPGRLGTLKQWKWSVSAPLKKGQSSTATLEERERAQKVANNLVHKLLPHFFLRRTKDLLVGQMPNKIDQVVFCPLSDKQKRVYRNFLATSEVQGLLRKDEPCDCGEAPPQKRRKCCHPVGEEDLLKAMTIFIKISNSLFLIKPVHGEDPKTHEMNLKLMEIAFPELTRVERFVPTEGNPNDECGKWRVLNGLLQDWNDENDRARLSATPEDATMATKLNKVLIFTKSRKLLEYIACALQYEGFEFRELHGGVAGPDRDANIDDFQNNPDVFVFLITTQTGGVGLNLTAANKVIIFDPNWNPAHDLQAMDRAFRIGQLRDVEVYRLVAAGCLEELIYKRQLYKQQQMMIAYEARTQARYFEGIQGVKDMPGELFGVKNIFALSDRNDVEERVEKARIEEALWRAEVVDSLAEGAANGKSMVDFLTESPEDTKKEVVKKKKEVMKKRLMDYGAAYTHSNEELLHTSIAESAKLNPDRYRRKRESNENENGNKHRSYQPPTRKGKAVMVLSD